MRTINWGRILLGGFVAGLVYCLLEVPLFFMGVREIVGETIRAANLSPVRYLTALALIINFLLATTILWVYVAIQPRFGPGPKTAVIAVATIWWPLFLSDMFFAAAGLFPAAQIILLLSYTFVAMFLAILAGARLYPDHQA